MDIRLGDIIEVTHTDETLIVAPIGNGKYILMRIDGSGYHSVYNDFDSLKSSVIEMIQKDIFIRYPRNSYKLKITKVDATT